MIHVYRHNSTLCHVCFLNALVSSIFYEERLNMPKEDPRIAEAQHALEVAAAGGYFDDSAELDNTRETHKRLEEAAMGILADQYPELRVKVITYPNNEHVDLKVVARDPKTALASAVDDLQKP